jgi:hypothetical protein
VLIIFDRLLGTAARITERGHALRIDQTNQKPRLILIALQAWIAMTRDVIAAHSFRDALHGMLSAPQTAAREAPRCLSYATNISVNAYHAGPLLESTETQRRVSKCQ